MKTVRFNRSPENAKKIQAYFPDITTLDDDTLTFSSFDQPAFELAIELEGLTKEAYSFFENHYQKLSWVAASVPRRSRELFFLEIDIYSSRRPPLLLLQTVSQNEIDFCSVFDEGTLTTRIHYQFRLYVDQNTGITTSREGNTVPLVVNAQLINFVCVIAVTEMDSCNYLNITQAAYFFDIPQRERARHFLQFECDGRSESIRFYPSSVWLNNSNEYSL
jgi:hypothetical protein